MNINELKQFIEQANSLGFNNAYELQRAILQYNPSVFGNSTKLLNYINECYVSKQLFGR